ncbi:MAG TPA: PD-(D/E)XK nuclease family protein [Prolixibacteraceae bacterium]|nr:PD-(D/E)XK nuclease family protein [Prolixibacteraceae bacterium]
MNPFLKQVANYLYTNHRPELSEYCLVFPGRRAGVFFTAYLNELIEKPMLSPEIITINELISSLTGLQQADPVSLVLKLQEVYSKETGHQEPLDEFFFWGEILLADFDDIDKYLLNADDLFTNLSDIKELENQFDYLSEEQKKAIDEFWGNLDKVPHSFNKDKFIGIWIKLAAIYHRFKDVLKQNSIAYSGMIYREVAEALNEDQAAGLDAKKYVFIGFNALNNCEKTIFRKLEKQHKAMFFWDYDDFYLKDPENEAGRFLRTNLVLFPAPKGFVPENQLPARDRKITMVSVPGNITQAQAINLPQVLNDFGLSKRFDNTAFVLADENLLIPVISSVGTSFEEINITMGYPFVNTPVYGFISQLISLQKNIRKSSRSLVFYYKPVVALLNHQFVVNPEIKLFVSGIHKKNKVYIDAKELNFSLFVTKIFSCPESWLNILDYFLDVIKELSLKFNSTENEQVKLESEYLFQAFLAIQRLKDTLTDLNVPDFPVKILYRLLDQSLRRISIPFEGEPLTGLQVMGLLETRCLDFENLVLFSANEGFLPRIAAGHSFVPYHLRKGFGMPTYEDRDAMYAYYFYRLIQRTEKTVIVYNSITEGVASSEKSRFLYQLLYDSEFAIEELNLSFNFKGTTNEPIRIEANESHIQKLISGYSTRNLSPSAINTYLECKLKFYFKYIARIKEKDEVKEEIDAVLFGNLFHYAIEILYQPFENKTVEASALKLLRADKRRIEAVVLQAVAVKYYQMDPSESARLKLSGQSILIASHIRDYIHQLLENDMLFAPFQVESLEKEYSAEYQFKSGEKTINICVGGIIDRMDRTAEGLRIIDYKTGRNLKLDFKEWSHLVDRNYGLRRKEIFQTLIYSDILSRTENAVSIFPMIYKLDDLFDDEFVPNVIYQNEKLIFQRVESEFRSVFAEVLSEMFSIGNIYDQTKDSQKCSYCPYNKICRR